MKSSGMKRGLAALAISGLAVAGIPALAMADSIDTQVTNALGATGVQLYNTNSAPTGTIDMTAKNDGTDTTVRLEAGGGENVPSVTFQVARNGGAFADIATVTRNDDGAFSTEWNPVDSGAFPGDDIEIRAFNTADPTMQDSNGGQILQLATANDTQAINITAGTQKGYWQDPASLTDYTVGVTGTTSVMSTNGADAPGVSWMDGNGNDQGFNFGSNLGDGTFEGVLNIAGYIFDDPALPPADPDQLVVRAFTDTLSVAADQTDDFESFTLYQQELTSVTATLDPAEEPDPGTVTVTVFDQNTAPIAGIEVFDANGNSIGFTDGRGKVTVDQSDDVQYYYANADANDDFSPGAGDKRSNDVNNLAASVSIVTSPSEGAQPVGTAVTETITVTDSNGDPISNRPVRIKRVGPGSQAETVFQSTDSNGVLTYEFTCSVEGVTTIDVGISGPVPPLADPFSFAMASDTVTCENPAPAKVNPNAKLSGKNKGNKDVLKVNAKSKAKGATVKLQKKTNNGWKQVGSAKTLNSSGDKSFKVKDKNGKKVTKYRAKVSATAKTTKDTSNVVKQK
jgi:hypothetical protein